MRGRHFARGLDDSSAGPDDLGPGWRARKDGELPARKQVRSERQDEEGGHGEAEDRMPCGGRAPTEEEDERSAQQEDHRGSHPEEEEPGRGQLGAHRFPSFRFFSMIRARRSSSARESSESDTRATTAASAA